MSICYCQVIVSGELAVEDIDDPHAYSIEDAKLKAEHDKMIREAEAKKAEERKKIGKLRKMFHTLQQKNESLPASVRLSKDVSKQLFMRTSNDAMSCCTQCGYGVKFSAHK